MESTKQKQKFSFQFGFILRLLMFLHEINVWSASLSDIVTLYNTIGIVLEYLSVH